MDPGDTPARRSRATVDLLSHSQLYREYQHAYEEATGLPLSLRPLDAPGLAHRGNPYESPLCALMAATGDGCAACLREQRRAEEQAGFAPRMFRCLAGLSDVLIPIRVGAELAAFLQTGQVLLHRPNRREFARLVRAAGGASTRAEVQRAEHAYFHTRTLSVAQFEALIRLLVSFARHLGVLGGQLPVPATRSESPQISRARAYIDEHQAEALSLSAVARTINMSAFYFCKMFKQSTGLNFTDYLARIRVEKVKTLLVDPNLRVSEAAFSAGFQSLSQFNRVFRKLSGEAPSVYRARLRRTAA
jgi:AraC-like DNA-binding protein/ligand-binding sensor protein